MGSRKYYLYENSHCVDLRMSWIICFGLLSRSGDFYGDDNEYSRRFGGSGQVLFVWSRGVGFYRGRRNFSPGTLGEMVFGLCSHLGAGDLPRPYLGKFSYRFYVDEFESESSGIYISDLSFFGADGCLFIYY